MLESIIDYSRALVIACDVIIYASYAFFLALGGVIVFAMWSRCGVYEFNCFLDVRKEYMGWVFMSQVCCSLPISNPLKGLVLCTRDLVWRVCNLQHCF
jgi:hypothetical protein